MGTYYSWGVLASGSPPAISATIKPMITDGSRLRKDGDVFVRSELRGVTDLNGAWTKNDTLASGTIPKRNTVERVFLVEQAGDKYPGVTRIGCSLQGTVDINSDEVLSRNKHNSLAAYRSVYVRFPIRRPETRNHWTIDLGSVRLGNKDVKIPRHKLCFYPGRSEFYRKRSLDDV